MKHFILATLAVLGLGAAAVVQANDGVAEMAAGGLVIRQTRDIDMLSENLFVSADEIRVAYVFRNRSARPVRTIVAFPLPDRNLAEMGDGETSWPADFRTEVDGRPVRMQVEHRAFLRGTEHTALLRELRIPIAGENIYIAASEAIERLPAAQQQRLERLGLVEGYNIDGRRSYEPRWTVREIWHWEQVFPVGRNLNVRHRYRPGAGGTAGSALADPEYRRGENGRYQIERYCIDNAFIAAVDRLRARNADGQGMMLETYLSYILTTGAGWRSPIGDFRLVVDKGRPDNLVSFCGEGVRRISPTQFEVRRRNWRPTSDLHVLILRLDRPGN